MAGSDAAPGGPAGKVTTAFLSFTEVTDPGAHRAYNEWHQLDHLPEQLPLPGVVHGQRWARTPACRAAGTASGLLAPCHYLTCYLMDGPRGPTLERFFELAADLRRRGRFFEARRALASGPFDVVATAAAPRVLVSAAAVPFRPGTGVYVTAAGDGEPPDPGPLCAVDGVAGAWALRAAGEGPVRWVTLGFLDGPPLEVAADPAWPAPGPATLLAGPLAAVEPGRWDFFDADGQSEA